MVRLREDIRSVQTRSASVSADFIAASGVEVASVVTKRRVVTEKRLQTAGYRLQETVKPTDCVGGTSGRATRHRYYRVKRYAGGAVDASVPVPLRSHRRRRVRV